MCELVSKIEDGCMFAHFHMASSNTPSNLNLVTLW